MGEREASPSSWAVVFNWIQESAWKAPLVQNQPTTPNNWVNLKLGIWKLLQQFAATKQTQPTLSAAEWSEHWSVQKALNGILIHHFLSFFFFSPQTGGYWLPSLQTCIDQYLFSEEYCANLKKLVYFVMGKKQSVNQTFGLSCQGSAVAKVQKYETAEIGQAGKKRDLCLQKWRQQSKRNGSIAVEMLPILRSP